jgi:hypothetical protein
MAEILVKIDDEVLEALNKCISINKMCGRLMPEFDEMHALAVFVAGGIHNGLKEITVFKVIPKDT